MFQMDKTQKKLSMSCWKNKNERIIDIYSYLKIC